MEWGKLNYFLIRELNGEREIVGYNVRVSTFSNGKEYERGDFSSESLEGLASKVIASEKNFLPIKLSDVVVTLSSYRAFGSRIVDKVPLKDALKFRKLLEQASEQDK